MSQQNTDEQDFTEYMRAFAEQLRANRRANHFLEFCNDLLESREATQLVWLVDNAVRTYMPELLGTPFTESEVWPRLRTKVLEDLERVGLKAWSVRTGCPIEQLDPDEFELADHVIVTERLNRGVLPSFDKYELPVANPWAFIGVVPETGYTPPKPSWWDHPRQYWKATRSWHNGRPSYEPAVSVRPTYETTVAEVRADLQALPLTVRDLGQIDDYPSAFEIVWDRTAELPAELKRTAGGDNK